MSKIELTISPNYVPKWTTVDAVRELFQNALDQEVQNPINKAHWQYDHEANTLSISNDTSKLTAASLLLGQTTKANCTDTIGQFGEGYKIATMVLLREGHKVTFYNYGAREVWRPRFVKSRKFGTDILTFFIDKVDVWKKVPSADLTVVVEDVTDSDYKDIVESNLHLRTDYEVVAETAYGSILDLTGKVFINGLYVCDYSPYEYGYNFKPGYVRLDRDRKMANDFDLRWLATRIWSASGNTEEVLDLVAKGCADVAFINDVSGAFDWSTSSFYSFTDKYGKEAIPVATQEELERVPKGYTGVLVNDNYNNLIRGSRLFLMPKADDEEPSTVVSTVVSTALGLLQEWFDDAAETYSISYDDTKAFDKIVEDLTEAEAACLEALKNC